MRLSPLRLKRRGGTHLPSEIENRRNCVTRGAAASRRCRREEQLPHSRMAWDKERKKENELDGRAHVTPRNGGFLKIGARNSHTKKAKT